MFIDTTAQLVLNNYEAIEKIYGVELTPIFLAYIFLSKNQNHRQYIEFLLTI